MLNAFEAVIWAAWKEGANTVQITEILKRAERHLRDKWLEPIDEAIVYNTLSRLKERDYQGEMTVNQ